MVSQEVIDGLSLARDMIENTDSSVVIIKNSQVLAKKKGDGVKPLLEIIDELGDQIHGSILGDRILGKASALLCRYAQVQAVYSTQATKTGIALLIMAGIPSQIDKMISDVKDIGDDSLCSIEKMLADVNSPEEAHKILKKKFRKKRFFNLSYKIQC